MQAAGNAMDRPAEGGGAGASVSTSARRRKTRFALAGLGILALVAGGVTWHASQRVALPAASGDELSGTNTASALPRPFRVATFNVHGCKGTDGRRDVARVAQLLTDYHLIGLNEVHGAWLTERTDQARELGRLTARAWLFAPSVRQWYDYDFGNGLLAAVAVENWKRTPLPSSERDPRSLLQLNVSYAEHEVTLLVTHATRRDPNWQDAQLREIVAAFREAAEPVVLMGDLNATADHPLVRQLLATPGALDPLRELNVPDRADRIDWIIVRGLWPVRAGIVANDASDHPLVWAELE